MRLGRRALFVVAAVLAAAVAVLPAVAGSETAPTIQSVAYGGYYYWSPSMATVGTGAVVKFTNESEVKHGFEWTGGPATPSCSGLPLGSLGATGWHGECTFTQPGTYSFRCTVHPTTMTGTITVSAGTTTSTTTTTATGTQPGPGGGGTPTAPTLSPGSAAPASPLAGSASQALQLKRAQRGSAVRGSLSISQAGSGARLEVDLLAPRASLARAASARQMRIGRLVRSGLKPGKLSFRVPISARARHTLQRHRRLALTVRISLSPKLGSAVSISRTVVLHA